MRRLSPGLIVVALALVAAGCGTDTKAANDYVDAVNQAQNHFAPKFDQLSGQITSTSTPAQDRQTLDGFRQAIDKVVADFRAVKAPDKVKALHDKLIAEISAYGRQIDKAKGGVLRQRPAGDRQGPGRSRQRGDEGQAQINQTIADINKKLRE